MRRILDLPLLVILAGLCAVVMLVPALHGYALRDYNSARTFLYGSVVLMILVAMVGIASAGYRPPNVARSQLVAVASAYLILPLLMAVPFHQVIRNTSFLNAWFEMLSCFTTTGATVYDTPGRLSPTLHLWRGLVGWLGGFYILVAAAGILAPLNLGGVEVTSGRVPGRAEGAAGGQVGRSIDPSERLLRQTLLLLPAYVGLTGVLWLILLTLGVDGEAALMLAMATLSTSGITGGAGQGLNALPVGLAGEAAIFLFLGLALTRRALPGGGAFDGRGPIWRDKELRLAAVFLVGVPVVLFLRHWAGAYDVDAVQNARAALRALWGAMFTTLSFLTTTGLESADWQEARAWSGLRTPGLVLLGLAMIGGGVATTAGGLKLLRVYALIKHGERELDRIIHPNSVGGGGEAARHLRREGAYAAWIFFMLIALSLAVVIGALSLVRLSFEPALVLTIAALTTTGPLAAMAAEAPIRYAELVPEAKIILGFAMILGRVEVLAILALLMPGSWRR